MHFKIDWASLIVGRKFTVFALFYSVLEGNFQVQVPRGLHLEGGLNGEFFALQVWGAYIWRGLYMEGLFFWNFRECYQTYPEARTCLKYKCTKLT